MSHKVTINLTDREFDLVRAACMLEGESMSASSVNRRVKRMTHNALELLEIEQGVGKLVEIAERYRRRKRVGLEVVEGDG